MSKSSIVISVLLVLFLSPIYAQMEHDSSRLIFDKKVDNDYVNNYTFGNYVEYFKDFYAIDSVRDKDGNFIYGCATEKYYNNIYYFDEKMKNMILGYDSDRGRSFIKDIGKVAVTSSGKIYVIDSCDNSIYFWDRNVKSYDPEGKIDRSFIKLKDICKDSADNLYILNIFPRRIYKYNTNSGEWQTFASGKDYIDFSDIYNSEWHLPSGIVVNSSGIYLSYLGGAIVKYRLTGEYENHFWIDEFNLGLFSCNSENISETWLISIATGPYGNIYVLDKNAKKIHIFNSNLEYSCSWEDPIRPIEENVHDISFVPGANNVFISYPWGFYSYELNTKLSGVKIDKDFIYPDYVGSDYKGIRIDLSVIAPGILDVVLDDQGTETKIVDQQYLTQNEQFHYDWDGRDKSGNIVPYGNYKLKFYIDNNFSTEFSIDVKPPPELNVLEKDGRIINEEVSSLEYNYSVEGEGALTVCIAKIGDDSEAQWEEAIYESDVFTGQYSQVVDSVINNEEFLDGYYKVNFKLRPYELKDYDIVSNVESRIFVVDKQVLELGEVINNSIGFNPYNPSMDKMGAHFSLSEGAHVSVDITDENDQLITNLFTRKLLAEGEKTIEWDGRNTDSIVPPDGNYRFIVSVEQDYLDTSLQESGSLFIMDTTPAQITYYNPEDIFYISPDEPSSIGIKDECNVEFSFNEEAEVEASIWDKEGLPVKTLGSSFGLGADERGSLTWDGKDSSSLFTVDGRYTLEIESEDNFGNTVANRIPVYIDNNRLQEQEEEQVFAFEEFKVNTFIEDSQNSPAIAQIDDGFVIVWESTGQDGSSKGIYAQRFDNEGNPIESEFRVNTYTESYQRYPEIAQIDNGFVVVWSSYEQDGSSDGIYAQRFDNEGNPIESEFRVNTYTENSQSYPAIALIDNGFVIAWNSWGQDGSSYGIYAQRFDNVGNPLGSEFRVNTYTESYLSYPAIAQIDDGFVIAWTSHGQDGSGGGIYAQRFDNEGNTVGSEFKVNTYTEYTQYDSAIAQLDNGFVIAWTSYGQDGIEKGNTGVYAQRFNNEGNPVGSEFRVNKTTKNAQANPSISQLTNGFIVVWQSGGQDPYDDRFCYGIYAQRFDYEGNPLGSEFRVNTYTDSSQTNPSIAQSDNGYIMAWDSSQQDSSSYGIYAKRYEIYTIPSGSNLTAQIISPGEENYTTAENFSIMGMASDAYIDRYRLSLIQGEDVATLATEQGKNITGELSYFNILSCEKGVDYTVKLEAWDKAGNYRDDSFVVTRSWDSDDFIESFGIDRYYSSLTNPPSVHFKIKEISSVSLDLINESNTIVKTYNLGTRPSSPVDYLLDIAGLEDGEYKLIINVSNSQFGDFDSLLKLKIDNQSPVVNIEDFGTYFSSQTDISVPASVEEPYLKEFALSLLNEDNEIIEIIKEGNSSSDLAETYFDPLLIEEGSFKLVLSAEDLAGNIASVDYELVIDRTNPVINFTSPDFSSVLSGDIDIQAEIADASGVSDYTILLKVEGNPESELFTGNTHLIQHTWNSNSVEEDIIVADLKFIIHDRAGNESVIEKPIVVDNNPPEVNLVFESSPVVIDGKQFINGNNKIYLNPVSDDEYSYVQSIFYKINEGDWLTYTDPITLNTEGNYNISYYGTDNNSNISEIKEIEFIIDASNPDFTYEINDPKFVDGDNIYVPLDNNISIEAADGSSDFSSGVKAVEYQVDDGSWQDYESGGFIIYNEGPAGISVRVTDQVGNLIERSIGTIIIDIAPPQTELVTEGNHFYSYQRNIIALSDSSDISLAAVDLGFEGYSSGVKITYYSLDGFLYEYNDPFSIPDDKVSDFTFFSVDNVDNTEKRATARIAVDTIPPQVELLAEQDVYKVDDIIYSKGGNLFGFSAEDNFAGVKGIFYSINGDEYEEYKVEFSFEEEIEALISCYAEDYLELKSEEKSNSIVIDNTAPTTTMVTSLPLIEIDGKLHADSRYVFYWVPADSRSGVRDTFVTIDGTQLESGELQFSFSEDDDGEHTIEYYSIDNVGNIEEKTEVAVITPIPDMTPPVSEIISSYPPYDDGTMLYFRGDVALTIESNDIIGENESYASGIDKIFYSANGAEHKVYNGEPLLFPDEGLNEISFYAVDKAGNIEEAKQYFFTIDNTPPESTLIVEDNQEFFENDILYITEAVNISINAVDEYSGVKTVYYKTDHDEDWIIYQEPFSLKDGEYTLEYYSEDNLGNTETIKSIKLAVVTDYNVVSYKTANTSVKSKAIKNYDITDNRIAYLRGSTNRNHIYIKDIDQAHGNLFIHGEKVSLLPKERKEIALGNNYIATSEIKCRAQNIFLYDISQGRQTGQQISYSGTNMNPLIIDNKVYWLNIEGGNSSIIEYDISEGLWETIYSTSYTIKMLKINDNKLVFMLDSEDRQEVYIYIDNEITKLYERQIQEENDRILSYSLYSDLLALEEMVDGKNTICLCRIENDETTFITAIEGKDPIIAKNSIFYTQERDRYEILAYYNIINNVHTSLLKGVEADKVILGSEGSVFIERKYNPFMFIHGLDWLYRLLNLPDYFWSYSFSQLVYLQNVERDHLVDDIKYATGLDSFTYNKYCDVEDFIYADQDITFPQFINLLSSIHHIQTFDSDKGSTDENYLGFKAKRDIEVIIITEKSDNYSNNKLGIHDLFNIQSPILRLIIQHFRRFDIYYYELNEGENFNLQGLGSKKFAPIIFIYGQEVL